MAKIEMKNCPEVLVPHPEKEEEEEEKVNCSEGDDNVLQVEDKYISDAESYTFPGPLMRATMQKDELMRFIQQKCQECLLHLDDPQQQKSYFFWIIMEHFFKKNGKVMMAELAVLLFRGHRILRRKLQRVENEDWCLPLAMLLCSSAPEDQLKENIIDMGDGFASKGWIYAAHICYVVAQVDLGSRPQFELIGCSSLPEKKSAGREAIERTEVYEYLLSLSSGFGQMLFQEYKCVHAFELAKVGLDALALKYCEVIATAALRFHEHIDTVVLQWVTSLSEKLLKNMEAGIPEWVIKLQQLVKDKENCSDTSDDSDQFSSEDELTSFIKHTEFHSRYTLSYPLGRGSFGVVLAGFRKADQLQVAIKLVAKDLDEELITIPGETLALPREVALLKMVSTSPRCEYVVELLEWFETPNVYILVLERPVPCMDLYQFCKREVNHRLSEPVAREIMRQVVEAADHCCLCGVFHRDIKPQNIVINTRTMKVKLIDFGCGALMKDEPFMNFAGTIGYSPPECFLEREYYCIPTTVWSLGIVLYEIVSGKLPFISKSEIIAGELDFHSDLSEECCDLISLCLKKDPFSRPNFSEIQTHKWFNQESQDSVQDPPAD